MALVKGRISNELKLLRSRQKTNKRGFRSRILLTLPAGSAQPGQSLATTFSQFGIDAMKFCNEFNVKTKDYFSELPIPIVVMISWEKTFSFTIRPFSLSFLISLLVFEDVFSRSLMSFQFLYMGFLLLAQPNNLSFFGFLGSVFSNNIFFCFLSLDDYISALDSFYA